jgi:hypothetical protein
MMQVCAALSSCNSGTAPCPTPAAQHTPLTTTPATTTVSTDQMQQQRGSQAQSWTAITASRNGTSSRPHYAVMLSYPTLQLT